MKVRSVWCVGVWKKRVPDLLVGKVDPILSHVFETARDPSSALVVLSPMRDRPLCTVVGASPINIKFWARYVGQGAKPM